MHPKTHIILGFFFALILFLISPLINLMGAILIFLSSFLIDFDHYIYYVFKKKNLSLKRALVWFKQKSKKLKLLSLEKRKNISTGLYIFHGIEIILILFIMGLFLHYAFYFVLVGVIFHLILDQIERFFLYRHPTKLSIIFDYIFFSR